MVYHQPLVGFIIILPFISCSVKPSNKEITSKDTSIILFGPMAPFLILLCLECLLLARLESPAPCSQHLSAHGTNVDPAGKRVILGLLRPAIQGHLERQRDFSRKRTVCYGNCPRTEQRAVRDPKTKMFPQGIREPKQVGRRRLHAKRSCVFQKLSVQCQFQETNCICTFKW